MANEKKPRGRPAGREFTHHLRVPVSEDMREKLFAATEADGKSAAEIVRELIDRFLRRRK